MIQPAALQIALSRIRNRKKKSKSCNFWQNLKSCIALRACAGLRVKRMSCSNTSANAICDRFVGEGSSLKYY